MWGERISCGRGEARTVGRRDWRVRRASREIDSSLEKTIKVVLEQIYGLLLPSLRVRSSGGGASDL